MDRVFRPPFWDGAASHAVEGPEGTGSLHLDASASVPVARQIFAAVLHGGFRNLHLLIHHQTESFVAGSRPIWPSSGPPGRPSLPIRSANGVRAGGAAGRGLG